MNYYVHDIAGRLRVRIPLMKGSQSHAIKVSGIVQSINCVKLVESNPITGSITVYYDSEMLASKTILEALENAGYFDADKFITIDQYISNAAKKASDKVSKKIMEQVAEQVLANSILACFSALV
jgi:copper chaperone CopZ